MFEGFLRGRVNRNGWFFGWEKKEEFGVILGFLCGRDVGIEYNIEGSGDLRGR